MSEQHEQAKRNAARLGELIAFYREQELAARRHLVSLADLAGREYAASDGSDAAMEKFIQSFAEARAELDRCAKLAGDIGLLSKAADAANRAAKAMKGARTNG